MAIIITMPGKSTWCMVHGPSSPAMLLGLRILNVNWNETRNQRDCVRTAPIDVLVPRAMWNSAKVLDISCFWLRKRSGTIGTTGTLEPWNLR